MIKTTVEIPPEVREQIERIAQAYPGLFRRALQKSRRDALERWHERDAEAAFHYHVGSRQWIPPMERNPQPSWAFTKDILEPELTDKTYQLLAETWLKGRGLSLDDKYKVRYASGKWVTVTSGFGYSIPVWRWDMPRITRHILDVSIYLYKSESHARDGKKFGGSGFIMAVDSESAIEGGYSHKYAVTNKHVIQGGFTVIRFNRRDGGIDTIETQTNDWTPHPTDDLAVYAFEPPKEYLVNPIYSEALLTPELLKERDIDIGSDTMTIGRFIEHDGKERNLPVVYFGNIAMMPSEPIRNIDTGQDQESFLVEAHTVSGTSGSVVYAANKSLDAEDKKGGVLGVVWGYLYRRERVFYIERKNRGKKDEEEIEKPALVSDGRGNQTPCYTRSNTGMMMVVPAWKLSELLATGGLVMKRQEKEQRIREDMEIPHSGAATSAANEVEEGEPDQDLTREEFERILRRVSRPIRRSRGKGSPETSG